MKPTLPMLLSINAGYVDTAGYLALQGLFTAHVTGNFVTLGATLALGTSGAIPKLLALPVFCIVILATRLLTVRLSARQRPVLRFALAVKVALLAAGATLAITLGPFRDADGWSALITGMTLVAAMAIQNALQRTHLGTVPPTTIMTGNTTQIMIDLADLLRGATPDQQLQIRPRLRRFCVGIVAFAAGCAAAAFAYALYGVWCFVVPPLVGLCALCLREAAPAPALA
jgi:uncharacterized membrane protein YoaK (UPF0700 family)